MAHYTGYNNGHATAALAQLRAHKHTACPACTGTLLELNWYGCDYGTADHYWDWDMGRDTGEVKYTPGGPGCGTWQGLVDLLLQAQPHGLTPAQQTAWHTLHQAKDQECPTCECIAANPGMDCSCRGTSNVCQTWWAAYTTLLA